MILVFLASKSLYYSAIKENSNKLPENATLIDALNKWDKSDFPVNYLDQTGCLIPDE